MIKNWFKLFTLSAAIAKRHAAKFLLAASLLAGTGMAFVPDTRPFTYPAPGNENMVVRRSEMGPLTGTTYNSTLAYGPGHDYGLPGSAPSQVMNSSFAYTASTGTSAQHVEFELTAESADKPVRAIGPGHDYGAIGIPIPTPGPGHDFGAIGY